MGKSSDTKLAAAARREMAAEAINAFNKMVPMLENFASGLVGRRISVKPSQSTYSTPDALYIRPPYALGGTAAGHVRAACGTHDGDGRPLCPACGRRDEVMSRVFHEISHHVYGSFKDVSGNRLVSALEASGMHERANFARNAQQSKRTSGDLAPIGRFVDEFSGFVLNVFEDIRVDKLMREARPGTGDLQASLASEAIGEIDWENVSPNAQATMAPLLISYGADVDEILHPYVAETVSEPAIQAIMEEINLAHNNGDSLIIAFKYIDEMKKYGFYGGPQEDEKESGEGGTSEPAVNEGESSDSGSEAPEESGSEAPEESDSEAPEESDSEETEESDSEAPEESDSEAPEESGSEETEGSGSEATEESDSEATEGSGSEAPGDNQEGGNGEESDGNDGSGTDGPDSDDQEGSVLEGGGEPDSPGTPGSEGGSGRDGDQAGSDDGKGSSESEGAPGEDAGRGGGVRQNNDRTYDGDMRDSRADSGDDGGGERRDEGNVDDDSETLPPEDFGSEFSSIDEAKEAFEKILGHDKAGAPEESPSDSIEISKLVSVFEYFDSPSDKLSGVDFKKQDVNNRKVVPAPDELVLGPSILHLRKALEFNKRAAYQKNRTSGRVDASALGKRAWNNDDRLFQKKTIPGKRDYAVLIGVDISGSTAGSMGRIIEIELEAVRAQAELCRRAGIQFAVFAHTGSHSELIIREIKSFRDPWNDTARHKLFSLRPMSANYDGHTLEFYRKQIDKVNVTDKIIMYYSDGKMPAENYEEELKILKREIKECKRRNITLMGVGVRTDDPKKYGMDFVRYDDSQDVVKVVRHLGNRLSES